MKLEQIREIVQKREYGLVWETKEPEEVELKMASDIPIFREKTEKKIFAKKDDENYNFLLEGDNLHSLHLLQKTHAGRIDVIYIDPPYNTGNKDFIYNDKFVDREDSFRHSKWLSFMEKRLKLAKNLLSDSGVIFISIDDNEQANLKLLCDQIFGEENFIGDLIWKKKTAAKGVPTLNMLVTNHDYVLCYQKQIGFRFNGLKRDDSQFSNPDNDPRGDWKGDNMKSTISPNYFTIKMPKTGWTFTKNWAFSQDNIEKMICEGRILWPTSRNGTPRQKRFKSDYTNQTKPITTLIGEWQSETATNKLKEMFDGNKIFDFPKPVELIEFLVNQASLKNSTILDFFAGSGTTGHAVLKLNAEDGGSRKFILCTNNENGIAENITYERIRRVINGYGKGAHKTDGIPANLKYFVTDFVAKKPDAPFELEDDLLRNCTALIELENGIDITNPQIYVFIDEGKFREFMKDADLSRTEKMFLAPQIFANSEEKKKLTDANVQTIEIPRYYFAKEVSDE